jgi:hypothetical protein
MRKFTTYLLFVAVAVVIVSLYGVIHHQVTFSVSPEYYTRFKFIQTNLADTLAAQHMTQPRSAVVIAAVKTSWVVGLCVGILIGLIALTFRSDRLFPSALQALGITIGVSAIVALICYYSNPDAHIGFGIYDTMPARHPDNLTNIGAFFHAASIQYGVLLGYVFGLAAAILFLFVKKARLPKRLAEQPVIDDQAPLEEDTPLDEEV